MVDWTSPRRHLAGGRLGSQGGGTPGKADATTTFDVDGCELWYDEIGSGEVLVALHGGLGLDHTYLRPWLDPLAETHRVVFPDVRANGRSGGDGDDLTMARLVEDLEALRAHLGAERMWLLGHSYGGFVALQHALQHPDRLHGVVLCDTDARPPSGETMMGELARLGADLEQVMSAFGAPLETMDDVERFFEVLGLSYLPHSDPGRGGELMADLVFRPEGSRGGDRALQGWDLTERLGEIAVPALVLGGVDDFMFPRPVTEALAAAIPQGHAVVLEDAGHLPFVEQQEAFLAAVRAFLEG